MSAAVSDTEPIRPSGVRSSIPVRASSSATSRSFSSVWMNPGDTQLTRTSGAHSSAAAMVSPTTAAFAAE